MYDPAEIIKLAPNRALAYQTLFDTFTAEHPEADVLEPDWPPALERKWQEWLAVLDERFPHSR